METIQWIMANYATIAGGLLMVVGGASVIAKMTPTPKDDEILAKVVKVLDFFAMNKQRTP